MGIFKEIPPTAGFPLFAKDFLSLSTAKNQKASLEEDFKTYLNVPYTQITYSGTAAFYLILEGLKELSTKKTIIIPSFICPLVPLAIHRSGLKVTVCDINKENFDFDSRQLQKLCANNSDILAILATHLGGIPADLESIQEIAKPERIFVIEDCAQSLGAQYKGKKVGALGDFSFFSLCRGKGLTIYEGGVIVVNRVEYIPVIDNRIKKLAKDDFFSETIKIFELFGYWLFYRRQLFWFVFRLPQAFWEWRKEPLKAMIEYFTIDFPIHKVSRFRKLIGHIAFGRLENELQKQREKASYYIQRLKGVSGLRIITETLGDKASYPYLTIVFDDAALRDKTLKVLKNSGLGVSRIYAFAITDYDYLKEITKGGDSPGARFLAKKHITLSTSTFLRLKDADQVIEKIRGLQ